MPTLTFAFRSHVTVGPFRARWLAGSTATEWIGRPGGATGGVLASGAHQSTHDRWVLWEAFYFGLTGSLLKGGVGYQWFV